MEKTPAVAYINYKIKTQDRIQLMDDLKHAPITENEYQFISDIINGYSYNELSAKYNLSEAGIYYRKRKIFETLHHFDMQQLSR